MFFNNLKRKIRTGHIGKQDTFDPPPPLPLPLRNLSENSFVLVGVYIPIFKRPGVFICCRTVSLHQAGDLTCWIAIFQIWGGIVSNVLCSHTGDFFPSHLRTFLSNFVATGVYALSLKSLPAVFFPCQQSFFLSLFEPNFE